MNAVSNGIMLFARTCYYKVRVGYFRWKGDSVPSNTPTVEWPALLILLLIYL